MLQGDGRPFLTLLRTSRGAVGSVLLFFRAPEQVAAQTISVKVIAFRRLRLRLAYLSHLAGGDTPIAGWCIRILKR